jgi:hypothetical protein
MGNEPTGEFGTADALREPRVVVDLVGRAGLAAKSAADNPAGPPPRIRTS